MRVLVIAPQPFFSPRGTPLSVYYRTLVTTEMGHTVDMLTYGQGVDVDIAGLRIVRIPAFRWLGEVKVGPSLLKAFLDIWIFFYALGMMARNRYDVVHAHEEAVFIARFLRPIFRYKLIYDLHSILSQQLTNFRFTRSRLLVGLFSRLENACLAGADAVISISPALAAYATARVRDEKRHVLIENSLFDPLRLRGAVDAVAEAPAWLALLDADRPLVLYAGTFESYQGIDLLLEAFARLRPTIPDAVLLLLGGQQRQVAEARRRASELGLTTGGAQHPAPHTDLAAPGAAAQPAAAVSAAAESSAAAGFAEIDCYFAGQVSRDLAQRATRAADVLTSPRTVGDNTPLKIYEQLASGVPLVATRIGSHTQVLGDNECILVDVDAEAMAAGLIEALRGGEAVEARVANARKLYEARYSSAAYRDKMQRLFDLVGG